MSDSPWTMLKVTAGRVNPLAVGLAAATFAAGLSYVLYNAYGPGGLDRDWWTFGRTALAYWSWAVLLQTTQRRALTPEDWPMLRLAGQSPNVYRGVTGPAAAEALLVWAAGLPCGLLAAAELGGVGGWAAREAAGLGVTAGLSLGALPAGDYLRTRPKARWAVTLVMVAVFLAGWAAGLEPNWPVTEGWLLFLRLVAAGWWTLAGGLAVGVVGWWLAERVFAAAGEDAALKPAMPTLSLHKNLPSAGEDKGPRSRPSRRLPGRGKPVRDAVWLHARKAVLTFAGGVTGLVLLLCLAAPAAAALGGFPPGEYVNAVTSVAAAILAAGTVFLLCLMPSMLYERALREDWVTDVLMPMPAKAVFAQVTAGCRRLLLVPAGLALAAAAAAVWTADERTPYWVGGGMAVALAAVSPIANWAAVSLTLRHPGRGWTQLAWIVGATLLLPVTVVYAWFHYRETVRRLETEPGLAVVDK